MASNITLRLAERSDMATLARVSNAGNAKSVLHRRIAPYQDQNPIDYHHWRLNIIRQRFASPNIRTIVAEDASTKKILGLASWAIEAPNTSLYKEWVGKSSWSDWAESKLLWVERAWHRYAATSKSVDYTFLDRFMALFQGNEQLLHPDCLRLHLIVIDPSAQSRGVGRKLVDWGKELAVKEDLPILLEATLEATGFYEKGGFSRLSNNLAIKPDGQEPIELPIYVWEGKGREGRWLERDENFKGTGERWKWRDDVLAQ